MVFNYRLFLKNRARERNRIYELTQLACAMALEAVHPGNLGNFLRALMC